jgi:hypothetical protein
VGGIEETITVTGESPVVDVQSARREVVLACSQSSCASSGNRGELQKEIASCVV